MREAGGREQTSLGGGATGRYVCPLPFGTPQLPLHSTGNASPRPRGAPGVRLPRPPRWPYLAALFTSAFSASHLASTASNTPRGREVSAVGARTGIFSHGGTAHMKRCAIVGLSVVLLVVFCGLANAGEQPFKGKKLTVSVNAGGRKASNSGDLYEWREKWEALSGAQLEIVEIPAGEHLEKIIVDNMTGANRFDASIIGSFWYGTLIAEGFIIPTEQFHNDPRMPKWPKDLMPGQEKLYKWGGKWYGVPFDHDGQALYYRKDILNDPKWKAAFKKEKGYDLPVPPKTIEQLIDVSGFFNGKDWNGDKQPDSGIAMHLKVGGQGMYHFMTFSAPLTVLPGEKVDRYHNVYDFDPETMEPLVNDPGHVRALEMLIKLAKTGPDAQTGWPCARPGPTSSPARPSSALPGVTSRPGAAEGLGRKGETRGCRHARLLRGVGRQQEGIREVQGAQRGREYDRGELARGDHEGLQEPGRGLPPARLPRHQGGLQWAAATGWDARTRAGSRSS